MQARWHACHAGVKGATALSQASITGGAISGVACLITRRHPQDPSKFLMDFDLALMLTPTLLLGVSCGERTILLPGSVHVDSAF